MSRKECSGYHNHPQGKRKGPSSYWMHDPHVVFKELALEPGDYLLDLGCGPGDYSLRAAREVGPRGVIWALDKWQYLIDGLIEKAFSRELENINAMAADITDTLPIKDHSVDLCLMSTVLHCFRLLAVEKTLFQEVRRSLKPTGRLAVIECKKEEQPFGPPLHLRISHQELEASLTPMGFMKSGYLDLGYTYLIQFAII